MDYKGYKIIEGGNRIIIKDVKDFNPVHIFECGQCFRWTKQKDNSYTGIVRGKVINVSFSNNELKLVNSTIKDFFDIWFEYFDLGRDYSEIKARLSEKDAIMTKAVEFGYGIRLLKQDIWETLISFIISANNRIPMIMRTVDTLSRTYGEETVFDDKSYYSFPERDKLSDASITELEVCRGGFRCKYINKTANMIRSNIIDLEKLTSFKTDVARVELTKLAGVGDKVADCTLLFSGTKYDVFPTDVWVKRVMEELYFKRKASFSEIQAFAREYFGEFSGIAQQYLFYYARENKIGTI